VHTQRGGDNVDVADCGVGEPLGDRDGDAVASPPPALYSVAPVAASLTALMSREHSLHALATARRSAVCKDAKASLVSAPPETAAAGIAERVNEATPTDDGGDVEQ